MTAFIADNALRDQILSDARRALAASADDLRADGAETPGYLDIPRATLLQMQRSLSGVGRTDSKMSQGAADKQAAALAKAVAGKLGIRRDGARVDSALFAGEGISRATGIVKAKEPRRALTESLPVRSVSANSIAYETKGVSYDGTADVYRPGMTEIPSSDYAAQGTVRPLHVLVTKTSIDWRAGMIDSQINMVAEKTEAATRTLGQLHESMLVSGKAGLVIDNLQTKGITATVKMAYDFAAAAGTDIGGAYAALAAALADVQAAALDRGGQADTVLIAPKWLRALMKFNNYAAGGSATGLEALAGITGLNAQLGRIFSEFGIARIIAAPALNDFGAAGFGAMVGFSANDPDGMRQVIASAPALVRTATSLTGDESLFAMIVGGLEVPDAAGSFILSAKVS